MPLEPSNSGSGSYSNLVQLYLGREENATGLSQAGTALIMAQPSLNYSGSYLDDRGTRGHYWTYHHYNDGTNNRTYALRIGATGIYSHYGNFHGIGYSLRCLTR